MPSKLLQQLLFLPQRLLFNLDDDSSDGLESRQTAYHEINDNEYKAERDLAEKYRSFVSESIRLSLLAIGAFSFLITNIKPPRVIPLWGIWLGVFGIILLGTSIFFAMRFMFDSLEGLRWYIAGARYNAEKPDEAQKALDKRGPIIERCRHEKFAAASFLLLGAVIMALASISAFLCTG